MEKRNTDTDTTRGNEKIEEEQENNRIIMRRRKARNMTTGNTNKIRIKETIKEEKEKKAIQRKKRE
jgi:hypothetical protein